MKWNVETTVVINDESISCLITCLSDWVRPLPRDGLGDQICEFSHVEDDADGRGRGHEDGEDGFLCGPWDETVHQVRTRPLVALHQPGHLEAVVNHIQGIPGDTDRTIATCQDTSQSDGGHAWHRNRRFYMNPPSKSSRNTRLQAYVHQRAPAIGSLRFLRVSNSSSWPLLLWTPTLPEPWGARGHMIKKKKLNEEEITHDQTGSNSNMTLNGTNDNDVTVHFKYWYRFYTWVYLL